MNKRVMYPKGNAMTFPLELAQIREDRRGEHNMKYLYPLEIASLQKMVSDVCDQMEYDNSMMYDNYPDKVTLQRMASSICCHRKQCCDDGGNNALMRPLVEVMLCHEMDCRREKRCQHKRRMQD